MAHRSSLFHLRRKRSVQDDDLDDDGGEDGWGKGGGSIGDHDNILQYGRGSVAQRLRAWTLG